MYHHDKEYYAPISSKSVLCVPFLPKRCVVSDKLLWLTWAYKVKLTYRADTYAGFVAGEYNTNFHWYSPAEYIVAKLKGKI